MISVVIPSRTAEYLQVLFESMESSQPCSAVNCIVADNGLGSGFHVRWPQALYVQVPALPFCFSQAVNWGVYNVKPDTSDLLILNDDTEIVTQGWLGRLIALLAEPQFAEFGLISCAVEGGVGNSDQKAVSSPEQDKMTQTYRTLAFVAMLIRRKAWDDIGLMDERFKGYGFEDDDYCRRAVEKGWKLGVTQRVVVKHGKGGLMHSSSYLRYFGQRKWNEMSAEAAAEYKEKWDRTPT